MMKSTLVALSLALLATGCAASPGKWARDVAPQLQCDMTIKEVETKAQRPVKDLKRAWGTHFVEDGGTDLWMTFDDGRLKSYQVAWVSGLKMIEKEPPVSLCDARK
jgi:hypothetical protein